MPEAIGETVVSILRHHGEALDGGEIITLDQAGARVRILPIAPR
jgi:hypothetical protein